MIRSGDEAAHAWQNGRRPTPGGVMTARLALASLAASFAGAAHPQTVAGDARWPERPIRLIVPFAPGSSSDTVARLVGLKLGERLGQQLVVENRVGRRRHHRHRAVASAEPDGYTLGLANTTHARGRREPRQPALRSGQGFRAGVDDGKLAVRARALSRRAATTLQELIALAKASPRA